MSGLSVIRKCLLFIFFLSLPVALAAQVSVLTQHNDVGRTGWNSHETILTTSNVNASTFGKLFARSVDGYVYAQPLYLPSFNINGTRNVVFVATEHNSVYAFDADDPNASTPLWQVNLGPSVDSQAICNPPISDCPYVDLIPEIGITATPVIDTTNNVMYVVAKTKDTNSSYHFRLHTLTLTSGAEVGAPVELMDLAATFDPFVHNNRAGLVLANGVVYVTFASVGDYKVWHGWVMAYDTNTHVLTTLNLTPVNNSLPGGGIWQAGQGLIADASGDVYFITSNGYYDGISNFGNSFIRLHYNGSSLSVVDWFTPSNQNFMGLHNLDLGSGGPLMIPGTSLIVGGGKDGIMRLVDTTNMGQFNSSQDSNLQDWQSINPASVMMGSPVYFNSPTRGPVIYNWGPNDTLNAWHFNTTTQLFDTSAPIDMGNIVSTPGEANTVALAVSSNGSKSGSGILWTTGPYSGDANETTQPGILRAFDASNLKNELWDSKQNLSRDDVPFYAKFNPPTIANGKVYLGTFADPSTPTKSQLLVYGLLAQSDFALSSSPSSASVIAGQPATYTITANPQSGFSGTVSFSCSGLPAGAACSFNPASVNVNGGSASSTLTVTTTAHSSGNLLPPNGRQFLPLYAMLLPIPGLALVGAGLGSRSRKSKLSILLLCGIFLTLLALQVGCGGGGSSNNGGGGGGGTTGGTPSGTYTVVVTGSGSSGQHTSQVSLTVQ